MGYDASNKKLVRPISVSDLSRCLGVASNDDGTYDVGSIFTRPWINKWARNKPFRADIPGEATAQDRINANYGLNWPLTLEEIGSDVFSAVKAAAQDTSCYAYDSDDSHRQGRPRGGAHREWFRMLDFDGYKHDVEAPMLPFTDTHINRFNIPGSTVQFELYVADVDNAEQMTMDDVIAGVRGSTGVDISGWHVIMAIEYSPTKRIWGISQETLDNPGRRFRIDVSKSLLDDGTPKYYLAAISDATPTSTSRVAALPFLMVADGYGYGDLAVTTEIPFRFDWQRVYASSVGAYPPASWGSMDVSQYNARYYQYHDGADTDHYLALGSDCDVAYGFKITNTGNTAAPLDLTRIQFESGLSVAAEGWPDGSSRSYPTGRIMPSIAYYATSKTGSWQQYGGSPLSVAAGQTVYVIFGIYNFQRYLDGQLKTALSGQSRRGAELSVYMDGRSVGSIVWEEASRWERPGAINIQKL